MPIGSSRSKHGGTKAVTSNVKEFVKNLDADSKQYHYRIMRTIARELDGIRQDVAEKEIVPRSVPWNRGRNMGMLYRLQPSTPGRVTSRTGMLAKVFSKGGYAESNWNIPRTMREARLGGGTSRHLYFRVRPQKEANRIFYIAEGSVRPSGENDAAEMKPRIDQELRHGRVYLAPAVNKISATKIEPELMKVLAEKMTA